MSLWTVIVTHNGEPWLETCLNSLSGFQVAVVDNASTDQTLKIIADFPQIQVIRLYKNVGFGQANNIGIRYALANGATSVFLLNQDAWVAPGTLEKLMQYAKANPQYGLLSPIHLLASGKAIEVGFIHDVVGSLFFSDLYMGKTQPIYPVEKVNAAAWLLSSHCIQEIGGFDPLFFMYGEDFDLCNRLRYHGWEIGVVTNAVIFHDKVYRKYPGWSGIPGRSKRIYADFLYSLKQPQRRFIINFAFWGLDIGYALLKALIDRNPPEFMALWGAFFLTLWRLPRIVKHYFLCRRKGACWL